VTPALRLVRETDWTYRVERADETVVAVISFIAGDEVCPPGPHEVRQVLLPWRGRRPDPVDVGDVRLRLELDPQAARLRTALAAVLADALPTPTGGLTFNHTQALLLRRLSET
jgi:hypothetical protein